MNNLAGISLPSVTQVLGVIAVKLVALALALAINESRGRELVPVVAVVYALMLPIALFVLAP